MSGPSHVQNDAIAGAILGCAVGDALGLPYEGLSKRRGVRLWGEPVRYRFLGNWGMVSDDTEQTCLVAAALCAHPRNSDDFTRHFARGLRWWLLGAPAGIGWATLRAILKLWLGFSPKRSGVFSAGNGPVMRSAIMGAALDDPALIRQFVTASTRLTHTDPKALLGALAVAWAARSAKQGIDQPGPFFSSLRHWLSDAVTPEFAQLLEQTEQSLAASQSTADFAEQLGCRRGVSGYVYRTVPVALHAWLTTPRDFLHAVTQVIRCGGDTDTTAAIVGAITGSGVGRAGIPSALLKNLWEWPRSVAWMEALAETTEKATRTGEPLLPPRTTPGLILLRNTIFLGVVLLHILRRMLPPY